MISSEKIREKIGSAGIKATMQRVLTYEALLLLDHPTAEQVHDFLKKQHPSISLATVYKTLDLFVNSGLIDRVETVQGIKRYDYNINKHNHIYCSNTNEIIDYFDRDLNQLIEEYFKSKKIENLTIEDIKLQIKGKKPNPKAKITIK